jgi:ATP synthase protein I
MRRIGLFLTIPMTLALAPTVGFLLGWFCDRKLGTFPWLTVLMLIGGFVAGAREVWLLVRRFERKL